MTIPNNKTRCMNDTKWEELRLAMYNIGNSPKWRTIDVENGYLSDWDGEWYYHFKVGGYKTIDHVEIKVSDDEMRNLVRNTLANIHVPGCETKEGFIVIGYIDSSESVEYIKSL